MMCGKIQYTSQTGAKKAIVKMKLHGRLRGQEPEVYYCQVCSAWHWSHGDDKEQVLKKNLKRIPRRALDDDEDVW